MTLSILLAAAVAVSAQGFVLDGREGAVSVGRINTTVLRVKGL